MKWNQFFQYLRMEKGELPSLIAAAVAVAFCWKHVFSRGRCSVQTFILQVTIAIKPQWLQLLQLQISIHGLLSALQLSVAANLLIMMTEDHCTMLACTYIKPRYLTSYGRKQWTSKAEWYFQDMFSKPPVNCSLNLQAYIAPGWREISVDFSPSIFSTYFLNSHKLLASPASCGNELYSFNCILCEDVFFFLVCFLKSVICSFHLTPLNPCIRRKMNNCPLCTFPLLHWFYRPLSCLLHLSLLQIEKSQSPQLSLI